MTELEELRLQVSGMTCTGCEQNIERVVSRLEGIRAVDADHTSGSVVVRREPGSVDDDAIRQAITEAGYSVVD
ncbi:MAG: copper chaperone [Acidimicrobiales bacterium]|nr:MAG: copper chaperone [Acidimicrobiales bacterium]